MGVRVALALTVLALTLSTRGVAASGLPPPQPPSCNWCSGPPPPPEAIPTIAPTEVAPVSVISVKMSPTHLQRGQAATLSISADVKDSVTTVLQYRDGKAKTSKGQVGSSRTLTKVWKVPTTAVIGKGQVRVTVSDPAGVYSTTISFQVVR